MGGNASHYGRLIVTAGAALLAIAAGACRHEGDTGSGGGDRRDSATAESSAEEAVFTAARQAMVAQQIEARGIRDPEVLQALRTVPRHLFVAESLRPYAYADRPLPIGEGQTISQPLIVALMTDLLHVGNGSKVLEVGTGSGYQAAVLASMGVEVYTIEIVEPLGRSARERLERLGYSGIHCRIGDGYRGWPEAAPFDGIVVTAAPDHVPQPLQDQLRLGGRLVIPVGSAEQELLVITRTEEGTKVERRLPVRFVPMTGEAQGRPF